MALWRRIGKGRGADFWGGYEVGRGGGIWEKGISRCFFQVIWPEEDPEDREAPLPFGRGGPLTSSLYGQNKSGRKGRTPGDSEPFKKPGVSYSITYRMPRTTDPGLPARLLRRTEADVKRRWEFHNNVAARSFRPSGETRCVQFVPVEAHFF